MVQHVVVVLMISVRVTVVIVKTIKHCVVIVGIAKIVRLMVRGVHMAIVIAQYIAHIHIHINVLVVVVQII